MNQSVNYGENATHIGDNNYAPLTSLEKAIEEIKKSYKNDSQLIDIIDELADYICDSQIRKVIGLEQKLRNGNRASEINNATMLKNRFERHIAKNQLLKSEQYVYIQILSAINSIWLHKIRPLIEVNEPKAIIDSKILEELIEPVHKAAVRYNSVISMDLISGMLFFLTGKCHVVWEP